MKEKIKKKLSLGIAILAIILTLFGVRELFSCLDEIEPFRLAWGILYIISAMGLLAQKNWAYRLTQAIFIFSMIGTPLVMFLPGIEFMIKIITVVIFEIIFGLILYYLSREKIKEQFSIATEEDKPTEKKSLQKTIGSVFVSLGYISYFIFGIWSFIINLSIANEVIGFWGVLIGLTLFPVLLIVMPWYAGVALNDWFPLEVTYGGLILATVFFCIGTWLLGNKDYDY